jgi:hypothetical protein
MSTREDKPKEFTDVVEPTDTKTIPVPDNNAEQIQEELIDSPAFKKFRTDLNDAQISIVRELAPKRSFDIEIDGQLKTFQRKKIKARDYADLERMRAQIAKLMKDPEKQSEIQLEVYEKCALHYLGMTKEDFDNSDFEYTKKILDMCNIVTVQGSPNT